MADLPSAAASVALQVLFEKVLNALSKFTGYEYRLLLGGDNERVNQDLQKLMQTLKRFQDDELKIFKHKEAREWYNRVKCAVNEADRILEALDSDSDDGHQQRVCNPFPTLFEFSVSKRREFGEGIASLLKKIDSLEVQKTQLNLEEINLTLHRETISTSSEVVFGRNDEKEQIVKSLLSDNLTRFPNGMDKLVNLQRIEVDVFVVGPDNGQRITGLQGLNCLEGSLTIRGLEHVRDAREAEAAFLNNKKNLSSLSLIWGDLHGSNSNVEGVLEALHPPQSLNYKLLIKGYGGSVFASWMKLLENLVRIELRDCIKCELLPPLGQLPLLQDLTIAGMNSLKCINTEFYGSNGSSSNNSSSERGTTIFPSLQKLIFEDMPNLEEWQDIERDSQQTDPCPCLEELTLEKCPKLKSLPSEILSFVQDLKIKNSDKVIVRSLARLTWLELNGEGTNSVTSFPATSLQNLNALEYLKIECYGELTFLAPLLFRCPSLQSIVSVRIKKCQSLKSLSQSVQYLSTLEYLYIGYCDQLELSSQDFQHLIKLLTIVLERLPKLRSLPELQHLRSLDCLLIHDCKNLKELPQWLQNLTSLRKLEIQGSDHDLESRCAEDIGEYWPFIKHIPKVRFSKRVQESDSDCNSLNIIHSL